MHLAVGGAPVHGTAGHLRDDALLHLAVRRLALGRDRVDLVDEEQRRRLVARLYTDSTKPGHASYRSGGGAVQRTNGVESGLESSLARDELRR